jgi:hypothetical protein
MRLKFLRFEFYILASLKAVFLPFKNKNSSFIKKAEKQYAEDGTHQISVKINEKF